MVNIHWRRRVLSIFGHLSPSTPVLVMWAPCSVTCSPLASCAVLLALVLAHRVSDLVGLSLDETTPQKVLYSPARVLLRPLNQERIHHLSSLLHLRNHTAYAKLNVSRNMRQPQSSSRYPLCIPSYFCSLFNRMGLFRPLQWPDSWRRPCKKQVWTLTSLSILQEGLPPQLQH